MVKIEDRLKHIPGKSIVILEVPAEGILMKVIADFLRFRQSDSGIYISSNRTTKHLIDKLQSYKFDLKQALEAGKICVVDLVSKSVGANGIKGSIHVTSPSELSATQIAIEKGIEQLGAQGSGSWLLIDSISTLLIYNSQDSLLHFLHYLASRLRVLEFDGVIFVVKGSLEEKVLATIRQFCDDLIRL